MKSISIQCFIIADNPGASSVSEQNDKGELSDSVQIKATS